MNKIFYELAKKLLIEDVSGKKTIDQIKSNFGAGTYQEIEYTPATECYSIENNILIKKTKPIPVNQFKVDYAKLATATKRINFIAERLGLK